MSKKQVELLNIKHNGKGPAKTDLEEMADNLNQKPGSLDRKEFLTLMGAATVMTTANCKVPKEGIMPYANRPEEVKPGRSNWYASICGGCPSACGTLVKTREGRPVKLEGNPADPFTRGGLCSHGQVSTYDLYDPDRLKQPVSLKNGQITAKLSWKKAIEDARAALNKAKNGVFLAGRSSSPSLNSLRGEFLAATGLTAVEYNPLDNQEIIARASQIAYGQAVVPRLRPERADVIVSVEGDFLGAEDNNVANSRAFSRRRKLGGKARRFNKLISFESMMSVTGMMADERTAIRAGDQFRVLMTLAQELAAAGVPCPIDISGYSAKESQAKLGLSSEKSLMNAVQALRNIYFSNRRGSSLIVAGGLEAGNSVAVQVAANLLNSMLGNDGTTVDYANPLESRNSFNQSQQNIEALVKSINAGKTDLVVIDNTNPAYYLPNSGIAGALQKLAARGKVIFIGEKIQETGKLSSLALARAHFLESWSDAQYGTGMYGVGQPVIRPLWKSRSIGNILIDLMGGQAGGRRNFAGYLRKYWNDVVFPAVGGGKGPGAFQGALQAGFVGSGVMKQLRTKSAPRAFQGNGLLAKKMGKTDSKGGLVLTAYKMPLTGDGAGNNNAIRLEVPDPVTKVTWGNFAAISRAYAEKNNIKTNDLLKVNVGGKSLKLPAFIQPGLHPDTVAVAMGFGREAAGSVGNGIGENLLKLNTSGNAINLSGRPVKIQPTGGQQVLAMTQQQFIDEDNVRETIGEMAKKRHLIPFNTYDEFLAESKDKRAVLQKKRGEEELEGQLVYPPLMEPGHAHGFADTGKDKQWNYDGPFKWGIAFDLASCTGCSACVSSCYIENNVPAVGPAEVAVGREMSWLRIDRYYTGAKEEELRVTNQPMLCQHCDNAPCETVCPVAATVHSDDGLNDMAYNRCVGTRYCANNCPFKVRRFNWREYWNGKMASPQNKGFNPDVLVRMRGVMEKCTMCVHRIHDGRRDAKQRGIQKNGQDFVPDGEIKTACQESCPTGAITFGNMNDPDSKIARMMSREYDGKGNANQKRGYKLLEEINVRPNVLYLAQVKNV